MSDEPNRAKKRPGPDAALGLAGLVCWAAILTGIGGLVGALVAVIDAGERGLLSAGPCLIASALAFGLLANAILRR